MRFAKYHGLGNDFLVVDLREVRGDDAAAVQDPAIVKALCDRQFGVGGDGVLAVLPGEGGADARMRVLNSDGSEAEMCGNGIRCVTKELFDRGGVKKDSIAIDTGAGRLVCTIDERNGIAQAVTVQMGAPRLARGEIPMTGPANERCVEQPLAVGGRELSITAVSMGNPHAVAFVQSGMPQGHASGPGGADSQARTHSIGSPRLRELAETIGKLVEHHPWFPRRTNAEFAHVVSPREIDLVVWERGCGITLACGTGASATVVAAVVTGRADEAREVVVHLPGGDLAITVERGLANVLMRGPAVHVFDGELEPRRVSPRP
jgi:diaminopimelate epimerase